MSISSAILRLARPVLETVLSQLAKQVSTVQEMALAPMRQMIEQVTGGIWIGEGANAFVDEVTSLMIPDVTFIGEDITQYSTNLGSARDIIEKADEEVNQLVQSRLADAFEFFS